MPAVSINLDMCYTNSRQDENLTVLTQARQPLPCKLQNRQPLPNSRPHKTLPRLLMQGRKPFMYVSKLYKGSRYVPLHSNPTARTASSCKRFLSPPCFCTKGSRLKEHLDKTKLQPHTFRLKQLSPRHIRTP